MNDRSVLRLRAVVPVKDFDRAKSRLHPALDAAERRSLSRSNFARVLGAIAGSGVVEATIVVTDSAEVAREARLLGAGALMAAAAGAGRALGAIVDEGIAAVAAGGAAAAIVLMGDLPRLDAEDVRALAACLDEGDLVIAPDGAREGTNAIAMRLPAPLPSCFGRVDSFAAHLAAAEARGLRVTVCARPGIAFDVDGPADLALL